MTIKGEAGSGRPDSTDPPEDGRRAWARYLSAADNVETVATCITHSRSRFAPLRAILRRLVEKSEPETSVCLGAGALNDLPFRALVRASKKIHLIDWVSGMADPGIARSAIAPGDANHAPGPDCIFCGLDEIRSREYCKDYSGAAFDSVGVCSNYLAGEDGLSCANYRRGCRPQIHDNDVTAGYANEFGARILGQINASRNRREAYAKATKLATRLARRLSARPANEGHPAVADGSADLVISSMVISQFEWEPYGFFARLIDHRFGPIAKANRKKALRLSGVLRDALFHNALDRHLNEIKRMLKPGGVGFIAFEMYHRESPDSAWFRVEQMHEAARRLDQIFAFDFEMLPAPDHVVEIIDGTARSLVYCFALRLKSDAQIQDGARRSPKEKRSPEEK